MNAHLVSVMAIAALSLAALVVVLARPVEAASIAGPPPNMDAVMPGRSLPLGDDDGDLDDGDGDDNLLSSAPPPRPRAADPPVAPAPPPDTMNVALSGRKTTADAVLTDRGGRTEVVVHVASPAGFGGPAFLMVDAPNGARVLPLNAVVNGGSTTLVDVPLAELRRTPYVIGVKTADGTIAATTGIQAAEIGAVPLHSAIRSADGGPLGDGLTRAGIATVLVAGGLGAAAYALRQRQERPRA